MPIGLCNASDTFQTVMNSILNYKIDDIMVVYLESLLVFSDSY